MTKTMRGAAGFVTGAQFAGRNGKWLRTRRWPRIAHAAMRNCVALLTLLWLFDRPLARTVTVIACAVLVTHVADRRWLLRTRPTPSTQPAASEGAQYDSAQWGAAA